MACVDGCRKQVHRFTGRTTTIEKSNPDAPDLTDDEMIATLKQFLAIVHPDTKLQGCAGNGCDCIRLENDVPVWSEWVKYTIVEVFFRITEECTYSFSGTYEVSSSIYTGNCMAASTAA